MIALVATAATFAFGMLFLPILFPGMRVRGTDNALKAGIIGGVLSAALGKVLFVLLSFIFLPIVLLGPLGPFLVQTLVNVGLLWTAALVFDGIAFDRFRTTLWAALALTLLQTLVRMVGQ